MKLEALHAHVERLLRRATGIENLLTNDQGEWLAFPYGRVLLFVRTLDHETPFVFVYGIAAQEVPPTAEMYEHLNDVNRRLRYCRAYWLDGTVYVEIELLGESLDYDGFHNAVDAIADAANHFGPRIVEDFGGRLPINEDESSSAASGCEVGAGTGLYL